MTLSLIILCYRFFLSQFENATEYAINPEDCDTFIQSLQQSGHCLLITGTFEKERVYLAASPTLAGRQEAITAIIQSSFLSDHGSSSSAAAPEDYIVAFSLWQDIVWKGWVQRAPMPYVTMGLGANRARIISNHRLNSAKSAFLHSMSGCVTTPTSSTNNSILNVIQEHKANLTSINKELLGVKNIVLRLAHANIENMDAIHVPGADPDLVQESFVAASDLCMRASRFLDKSTRHQLDTKLLQLAIRWMSFITNECTPTDRRTFRWAVTALDFAQVVTRGNNVLMLQENDFMHLQHDVARCITLLISHFDVLGTRWREYDWTTEQRRRRMVQQQRRQRRRQSHSTEKRHHQNDEDDEDAAAVAAAAVNMRFIHNEWMRHIRMLEETRNAYERENKLVGRVLEDQKPEDRSMLYLAPSASSISFRWQQGRFIGAGTFGSVYLAINLDTSCMMAVKEIRFQDSDTLSSFHKTIKEEMQVMDMLNHPNIVQYHGMEVHRDKVYIFMEYCENGSLESLLQHGGCIQDERYIVDYAHQLLKGLAYLHENNVVHRDIKPDSMYPTTFLIMILMMTLLRYLDRLSRRCQVV